MVAMAVANAVPPSYPTLTSRHVISPMRYPLAVSVMHHASRTLTINQRFVGRAAMPSKFSWGGHTNSEAEFSFTMYVMANYSY